MAKKNSKNGDVVLLSVIILILFSLVTIGIYFYQQDHMPIYEVGDCVKYYNSKEENWNQDHFYIKRIEEVGKFSYRTSYFLNKWSPAFDITFFDQRSYKKVCCPQ